MALPLSQNQLASRIQQARNELDLTQKQVSDRLGFKDRQILSNIESGSRRVSADELVAFMSILKKPLEYFTDPYLLTEPKVFSWRADPESTELERFEPKARNLVMAYRRFNDLLGEKPRALSYHLTLSNRSSYEDALLRAKQFVDEHQLGDRPAWNLEAFVRETLRFVILYVDAPNTISGAACHLSDLSAIFINRNDLVGRRHFGLAHEIFHLLTWDTMPPETIDPTIEGGKKQSRVEQLANNFASALLMPETALTNFWDSFSTNTRRDIHERIIAVVQHFGASGISAYWRLRNLGLLSEGDAVTVNDERLKNVPVTDKQPRLYGPEFADRLHRVLDKGLVSVRKAAELLDTTVEGVASVLREYGKEVPFEI